MKVELTLSKREAEALLRCEFSGGHGVRRSQALLLAEFKVKDAVLRARREGACGRLLVGQGEATWDPSCALPVGHEGLCRP